ncbi:MAG: hypothetical protein ABI981_11185 [Betaproteobacteria bacterium]
MRRICALVVTTMVLGLAGCGPRDADKTAAPETQAQMPIDRGASPGPTPATVPPTAPVAAAVAEAATPPPSLGDDGGLYTCVVVTNGAAARSPIELSPAVDTLCRKAPEMGPCQYEREACRRKGGRVYTTTGAIEITRQLEDDYDRKVMRIRMKSN